MDSYIDYDYYSNTFGGTLIPEEKFDTYGNKASNEVRIRIMNRDISDYETAVQNVTCSVAEVLYNQQLLKERYQSAMLGNDALITSEKVGDYSRSMSSGSIGELKAQISSESTANLINEEVEALLFTGLLYKGLNNV